MASYPAPSENLSVFTPSLFNSLTDVGPGIQFENGTIQTTAYTGGGGGSQTLAQTLVLGNSAGASSINMNNQNITSVNTITATGDLTLNPVGSISCNGKTLDMTNGEIHNTPLIHSQNNSNITIEAKGTGIVILKGNNANTQIQSTGLTTVPTLQVQDTTTAREVDIYTNSTASNQNPIVQANDTTIIGKGTTLTNGVIDIATNSATTSGVRITNNTALIGAGGTSATPSYYVKCDPTNSLIDISGNTKITGNCEVTGQLKSPPLYGGYNYGLTGGSFYVMSGTGTNLSAGNFQSNKILFSPFFISKDVTITTFGTRQGAATAAAYPLIMALYSNDDGYPLNKLGEITVDTKTTATGSSGTLSSNLSPSINVPRGFYWSAFYWNTSVSYPTNVLRGLTPSVMYSMADANWITDFSIATSISIVSFTYDLTAPITAGTLTTPIVRTSLTRRSSSAGEIPLFGIQTA